MYVFFVTDEYALMLNVELLPRIHTAVATFSAKGQLVVSFTPMEPPHQRDGDPMEPGAAPTVRSTTSVTWVIV